MRVNPMDILTILFVITVLFVVLWLIVDFIRTIRMYKEWERELDEDTYTVE